VLVTEFRVEAGKVAVEPDGTEVTRVIVEVDFSVVCSDPGQLTRPGDSQLTPVKICFVESVVVVRSRFAKKPPEVVVAAAADVVVQLDFVAQRLASVV
jgi:hypothetical protein